MTKYSSSIFNAESILIYFSLNLKTHNNVAPLYGQEINANTFLFHGQQHWLQRNVAQKFYKNLCYELLSLSNQIALRKQ